MIGIALPKFLQKNKNPISESQEIADRSIPTVIPEEKSDDDQETVALTQPDEPFLSDDQEADSDILLETPAPSENSADSIPSESLVKSNPDQIPDYIGVDYIVLNDNQPMFTQYDVKNTVGESFSDLDSLGRCGAAMAMIDRSMMPTEERGAIGMIKPSGWHTVKYPEIIGDLYLYNRCHLIGYALTGQNANELNLITGTRYFNISIMPIFEREAIHVIEDMDFHVLYRVTPYFKDDELVARGVEMEGYSVEDGGKSLCFNVFCYNIQPRIGIDYKTGDSWELDFAGD